MSFSFLLLIICVSAQAWCGFMFGGVVKHQQRLHDYVQELIWRKVRRQADVITKIAATSPSYETTQLLHAFLTSEKIVEAAEVKALQAAFPPRKLPAFISFIDAHVKRCTKRFRPRKPGDAVARAQAAEHQS